jgi:hypothetical protein
MSTILKCRRCDRRHQITYYELVKNRKGRLKRVVRKMMCPKCNGTGKVIV